MILVHESTEAFLDANAGKTGHHAVALARAGASKD